jgi:hypothetical protein
MAGPWESDPVVEPLEQAAGAGPALAGFDLVPITPGDPSKAVELDLKRTELELKERELGGKDAELDAKKFGTVTDLRKEFEKSLPVEQYRQVLPLYVGALQAGPGGAGDLNLIYALGKAMDPGSVVREGELQLAATTGSAGETLKGYYKHLTKGGSLTPEVRAGLMRELQNKTDVLREAYDHERSRFERIAQTGGYDPWLVTGDHPIDPYKDVIHPPISDEQVRAELEQRIARGDDPQSTIQWLISLNRPPTEEQLGAIFANAGNPRPDVRMPDGTDAAGALNDLGVGARGVVQGAGDIANILSSPVIHAVNAVTGANHNPDMGDALADVLGLPEPQSDAQRLGYEVNRFGTGGLSIAGLARRALPHATGVVREVLKRIADNPIADAIAGSTAGAATEATRQAGGGPVAQAVAGVAGGVAGGLGTAAAGTAKRTAAPAAALTPDEQMRVEAAQAAQDLDIGLPKFVAGGPQAAKAASAMEQTPFGAKRISDAAKQMIDESETARSQVAADAGKALEPEGMGQAALEGGNAVIKRERGRIGKIYEQARTAAADTDVPPPATIKTLGELYRVERRVPGGTKLGKVLETYVDAFAEGGPINIEGARKMRSELRTRLRTEAELTPKESDVIVRKIMGAVTEDIESGLNAAGKPDAVKLYRQADTEWSKWLDIEDDVIKPYIGKDGDAWGADVAKRINSDVKGNGVRLAQFLKAVPEDQADNIRASLIMRLGRATKGQQDAAGEAFSLDTFLTNWDEIKGARNLIFPKETHQALEKLAKVAEAAKAAGRARNPSGTGGPIFDIWTSGPTALGGAGALAMGDVRIAIAGALASGFSALSQWGRARALASPAFAKRVASTPMSVKGAADYWSRPWVEAIKRENPGLAADINAFQQGFLRAANENVPASAAASDDEE